MEHSTRGRAADVERIARAMAEEALTYRNFELDRIESISAEWEVDKSGAVFAGVALIPEDATR